MDPSLSGRFPARAGLLREEPKASVVAILSWGKADLWRICNFVIQPLLSLRMAASSPLHVPLSSLWTRPLDALK